MDYDRCHDDDIDEAYELLKEAVELLKQGTFDYNRVAHVSEFIQRVKEGES
jgi:predicted RNase H-like HicB family nuclease